MTFQVWLKSQKLVNSTRGSLYSIARTIVLWCARNVDGVVSKNLVEPTVRFSREPVEQTLVVGDSLLRKLLLAAYSDIDEVSARIRRGRRILAGEYRDAREEVLGILLKELLKLGNGRLPSQWIIARSKNSFMRRVTEQGGLRELSRQILPTPEDVFPFYLSIVAQTAGNPMAIHELRRDCVQPHPLRDDRKAIVWSKRRSRAEQKADFAISRMRSAPHLVEVAIELSEPLVPLASKNHREMLFLANCESGVRLPCFQLFHLMLNAFIAKHNLPNFDFKQLRRAVGHLHHQESGDLLLVARRLNHRSTSTTARYIEPNAFLEANDQLISRFQGELVAICSGSDSTVSERSQHKSTGQPSETVFGFLCRDPYAGIAPGMAEGVACSFFAHCATCPGAIITLDDPRVVGRLVRTAQALHDARERATKAGWLERYHNLYDPILKIIEEELLPKVSQEVLDTAASIHPLPAIPYIE